MKTKSNTLKYYTKEEVMAIFKKKSLEQQNKILDKALKKAISRQAGTVEYAIATSMGFHASLDWEGYNRD